MNQITKESLQIWMDTYGQASRENDVQASVDLFGADAEYYESPFSEPLVGKEALYQYWASGAQNLKEKVTDYEILALIGNLGIAHWWAQFLNINTGRYEAIDCIFLVEFDEDQKCHRFREWWHSKIVNTGVNIGWSHFLTIL